MVEKYKVIRLADGKEVSGFFVLRPQNDPIARECIKLYAEKTDNEILKQELNEWMDEYGAKRCVDPTYKTICPKVQSPVCCCHCKIKDECFEEGGDMCKFCESGQVIHVEECKYNLKEMATDESKD